MAAKYCYFLLIAVDGAKCGLFKIHFILATFPGTTAKVFLSRTLHGIVFLQLPIECHTYIYKPAIIYCYFVGI